MIQVAFEVSQDEGDDAAHSDATMPTRAAEKDYCPVLLSTTACSLEAALHFEQDVIETLCVQHG